MFATAVSILKTYRYHSFKVLFKYYLFFSSSFTIYFEFCRLDAEEVVWKNVEIEEKKIVDVLYLLTVHSLESDRVARVYACFN